MFLDLDTFKQIIDAIELPLELRGTMISVGVSIAVIRRSDRAMHAVKKCGKGGYQFFNAEMTPT